MGQYGYITPAFSGSPWWGEINLERSGCGGNERGMCEEGWKWVRLGENAISPLLKKHQNLLSNKNDGQSITKYGFLVWPHAQIVALCMHSVCTLRALRLKGPPCALPQPRDLFPKVTAPRLPCGVAPPVAVPLD